jgi:hypothetical protein
MPQIDFSYSQGLEGYSEADTRKSIMSVHRTYRKRKGFANKGKGGPKTNLQKLAEAGAGAGAEIKPLEGEVKESNGGKDA